ncbi:MAG: ATP-binding cassette domain-containing protein, partial [Rhodoferax sp.]
MSSETTPTMAHDLATLQPLLTVTGLVKKFGSFHALDGMGLDVKPGEVLGLIGPNGSGKTTCINVITGLHPPDAGTVLYQGKPIGGLPSHRLARLGINRTFQVPKPFM